MAIITNSHHGGIVGVVGDGKEDQYAIESEHTDKTVFLTFEQQRDCHKAAGGDMAANDRLKDQGIRLRHVAPEVAAQNRADLADGAEAKFANDPAKKDKFVKQMNSLGGNHKTFWQSYKTGWDRNSSGTVPLQGQGGKLWQLTRNDGKSPTADDIGLGIKVVRGDAAAAEQAKARGLLVAPPKDNAAQVFEPTTAGMLSGNTKV